MNNLLVPFPMFLHENDDFNEWAWVGAFFQFSTISVSLIVVSRIVNLATLVWVSTVTRSDSLSLEPAWRTRKQQEVEATSNWYHQLYRFASWDMDGLLRHCRKINCWQHYEKESRYLFLSIISNHRMSWILNVSFILLYYYCYLGVLVHTSEVFYSHGCDSLS